MPEPEHPHSDQHRQPGIDIQDSRMMEGGGRAVSAAEGGDEEGGRVKASIHANQHEQPPFIAQESTPR